jgi:hypothetical protein
MADDLEKERPFRRIGGPQRINGRTPNQFDFFRFSITGIGAGAEEAVLKELPGRQACMLEHGRDPVSLLPWRSMTEGLTLEPVELPD